MTIELVDLWPLFGLQLRTERLTLTYLDDSTIATLMRLVAEHGAHDPAYMPFGVPWTRAESPELERNGLQYYWGLRVALVPTGWNLPLAVSFEGQLVGVQSLQGKDFGVTKTFGTGSWLIRPAQGKGIGKEMRNAVLHLGFEGLGAELATSSAFHDNPRSVGVSRRLGYEDDGWELISREGVATRHDRFRMDRAAWAAQPRPQVSIEGLEACRPLLGA